MEIIKAVTTAVGGAPADQWPEAVKLDDMGDRTVLVRGVQVCRGKGSNTKGSSDIVSDGSVIRVYPNQFMMPADGGKIVDYMAEGGHYKVSHSSMPSMFNGQFGGISKEPLNHIHFGGVTLGAQKVYYVSFQEVKGVKSSTCNPVNYFDNFYNAEPFLRAHGMYPIKVTDLIKFCVEVTPKNADHVEIDSINEQYLPELLEVLQTSINQMSADGIRISYVISRSRELGQHMAQTLGGEWTRMWGMEIQAAGTASITYDEESQNLISLRNRGAMISNPSIREGYVQTTIAEGLKNVDSNDSGAMADFMGMGMGMRMDGDFVGAAFNTNMQQVQTNQAPGQMPGNTGMPGVGGHPTGGQPAGSQPMGDQLARGQPMGSQSMGGRPVGSQSMGGQPAGGQPIASQPVGVQPAGSQWATSNQMVGTQPGSVGMVGQMPGTQPGNAWTCPGCGTFNTGRFCGECGHSRFDTPWTCARGNISTGKFCSDCRKPRP